MMFFLVGKTRLKVFAAPEIGRASGSEVKRQGSMHGALSLHFATTCSADCMLDVTHRVTMHARISSFLTPYRVVCPS